jgi:E3 ubiquitin-protein ligase HERC3
MGDSLRAVNLGTGRQAVSLACGPQHNCAVLDDGSIKCWGIGTFAQLGMGDVLTRGITRAAMGDALPQVTLSWIMHVLSTAVLMQ